MPIVYPYLPTNTDFSADPLNVRFEEFIGATSGLNKLTVEDLSVGALRHNHLPRLIHREANTYAELTAAKAGDPNQNLFSVMRSVSFGSTTGKLTPTERKKDILTHIQPTPLALGMSDKIAIGATPGAPAVRADDNIAALIVLVNVNIQRFIVDMQDDTLNFPCEDREFVVASIVLVDSADEDKVIERTVRAVSPRVTINYETSLSETVGTGGITQTTTGSVTESYGSLITTISGVTQIKHEGIATYQYKESFRERIEKEHEVTKLSGTDFDNFFTQTSRTAKDPAEEVSRI